MLKCVPLLRVLEGEPGEGFHKCNSAIGVEEHTAETDSHDEHGLPVSQRLIVVLLYRKCAMASLPQFESFLA